MKEVEAVPPFASGDIVKIMEIIVDEESFLVGDVTVMSIPRGQCMEYSSVKGLCRWKCCRAMMMHICYIGA